MCMKISIPELSLVFLFGPPGCSKSTFVKKYFLPTEVASSVLDRALVGKIEQHQSATDDTFDLVHEFVRRRLSRGMLAVVEIANMQPESYKLLVELSHEYHVLPIAIVFDLSKRVRQDRSYRADCSLHLLKQNGFRYVYGLSTEAETESVTIERQPLWNKKHEEHGPFDIIGDVHGCLDELLELMALLGYEVKRIHREFAVTPPDHRKLVFVGDLVDRGPATPDVLRLIMTMVGAGQALCVPGNHDVKLAQALKGKYVKINHGLALSLRQLTGETAAFRAVAAMFLDDLVSHFVLDDGKLVIAHAGMKENMQGRGSVQVREFALFGETTGETDDSGMLIRYNWAADYRGKAQVVYGHTPVSEATWINNTINIDTGCVYGGRLTALRYPEREVVSVPAKTTYTEPLKPFLPKPGG
jgi:protein phosphatase